MLEAIFAKIGAGFIDRIFGGVLDIAKAVINKQVTDIEAKKQMTMLVTSAIKDIELKHADVLAQTYATFWNAADNDKTGLLKFMWAVTVASQVWVLFWAQWCAPMLYAYGYMDKGWKDGGTSGWAYALVGALLGLGPMVLRTGPAAGGGLLAGLKALIGR